PWAFSIKVKERRSSSSHFNTTSSRDERNVMMTICMGCPLLLLQQNPLCFRGHFYFLDVIGGTQELCCVTRYMTVFWCRYHAFPHTMFHRMAAALFGATGLQLLPSS